MKIRTGKILLSFCFNFVRLIVFKSIHNELLKLYTVAKSFKKSFSALIKNYRRKPRLLDKCEISHIFNYISARGAGQESKPI